MAVPSLPEFIRSLPDALRATIPPDGILALYLRWASLQWPVTPASMHAAASLVVLAHEALTHGFYLGTSAAYRLPPFAIRVACVASSAAGKSSAVSAARSFHRTLLERTGRAGHDPWMNLQGSEAGLEESLAELYDAETNQTRVIGHHEEFTALLTNGRSGTYRANEDWFNRLFDGLPAKERLELTKAAKAARKEAGKVAENPVVQAIFCSTPAAMRRSVTEVHREGGFLSRVSLWAGGEGQALPAPFAADDDDETRRVFAAAFEKAQQEWDRLQGFMLACTDRRIYIERDAQLVLNDFVHEACSAPGDEFHAVRIRGCSLVLHVTALHGLSQAHVRGARHGRVVATIDDARSAIARVRASWEVQREVYDHTVRAAQEGTTSTPTMRFIDRIYDLVHDAGPNGINRDALRRRVEKWSGFSPMVYKAALDDLLGVDGKMHLEPGVVGAGGGRPSARFVANVFPSKRATN